MATSIIRSDSFYSGTFPGGVGTMGGAASINDILVVVIFTGDASPGVHGAASVSGATCTLAEQFWIFNNLGSSQNITFLTGIVTGAGTPVLTLTAGGSDIGMCAWIVRGPTTGTKTGSGAGAGGTASPLVASDSPAQTGSLFVAWQSEVTDVFTGFTSTAGAVTTDQHNTSQYHAAGHLLDISAGTYSSGATVSSGIASSTTAQFWLPSAAGSPTIITSVPNLGGIYPISAGTTGGRRV